MPGARYLDFDLALEKVGKRSFRAHVLELASRSSAKRFPAAVHRAGAG